MERKISVFGNTISVPPNIFWINENIVRAELKVKECPELKEVYDHFLKTDTLLREDSKDINEKELNRYLYTVSWLSRANEIITHTIDGLGTIQVGKLNDFKVPFKNTIVVEKSDSGFYNMTFVYIERLNESDESDHHVYAVKQFSPCSDSLRGEYNEPYRMSHYYLLIPHKFPALYFPTRGNPLCKNCKHIMKVDMRKYITNGEYYQSCGKTDQTANMCKGGFEGRTYANQGFVSCFSLKYFMDKFYREPDKIPTIAERPYTPKKSRSITNIEERRYIELKDTIHYYEGRGFSESQGGTHASPCEHVRRPSTRTLKSGKIVQVKGSIVNPGNKKPVYVLK